MNALLNNPFVSLDEDNSEEEYFDATILFRFANDLGALMTYVMLDAVNPNNMADLQKGSEKDESVREKIINAIQIDRIFREFCRLEIIKHGRRCILLSHQMNHIILKNVKSSWRYRGREGR